MRLAIYGAGGLGREVFVLARQIDADGVRWDNIFFVDDANPDRELKGIRVESFEYLLNNRDNTEAIIAVGEPATRALLADRLASGGIKLATLIHPSVAVPECSTIGEGTIICKGAIVSCDVTIGENVFIQPCAVVAHDGVIGRDSVISSFAAISGACRIGDRTYISINTAIREKVEVGCDVIIGMCSAVLKDIPPNVVVVGNPAKVIKNNDTKRVFR